MFCCFVFSFSQASVLIRMRKVLQFTVSNSTYYEDSVELKFSKLTKYFFLRNITAFDTESICPTIYLHIVYHTHLT